MVGIVVMSFWKSELLPFILFNSLLFDWDRAASVLGMF